MKIIFFGTPKFGAIILDKLAQSDFKPVLVVTEPDKPAGRNQELKKPECKIIAEKYKIPVEQPARISNFKFQILNLQPDLIIVAAYGQIIPKDILEIPKYGCLNVHPSLLPKYRGPSPIQYAIFNQEKETGVTIIKMDEKIDHGPIISNFQFSIFIEFSNPNFQTLETKLAELGADLLIKTIPDWVIGKIKAVPQNESEATFTKIIKKEDGKIDWQESAEKIEAKIRAFKNWPGNFCLWNEKRIKILEGQTKTLQNNKKYDIGEAVAFPEGKIAVSCGSNFLVIKKLQIEGKKPMNADEFIKGHPEFIGSILK